MKVVKIIILFTISFFLCTNILSIDTSTQDTLINDESELTIAYTEYTPPQYYDYTGDDLPADIVMTTEYIAKSKINPEMPEFVYKVHGHNVQSYDLTGDHKYYYIARDNNKINRIVIKCDEISYIQELIFEETLTPNIPECTYGFSLDDWNFDGYLDISLWKSEGGTSLNSPHLYWLWDVEKSMYVKNLELENINEDTFIEIDIKDQQIIASYRLSDGFYHGYYKWQSSRLLLVKTIDLTFVEPIDYDTGKSRGHYIIKELIDGEMQVTEEYYKD